MRVFLSYSPADKRFAKQLAAELPQRGCEVWDPRAELPSLRAGSGFIVWWP